MIKFINFLAKKGNKNRVAVLICTIMLAVSLGTLAGCSITKENTEDDSGLLGTEDIQDENSQTSQPSTEAGSDSSETGQSLDDRSIMIGNISLSVNENKQDIFARLDVAGLDYSEFEPDDPETVKYGACYNIDEVPVQMYFLDEVCVRLRAISLDCSYGIVQTVRGLQSGSTYSKMVELYGDSYETHAYVGKEVYTIYRYSINDFICEFGIPGENRDSIYNIDIYVPSQTPIYDYGEELMN